MAAAAADLPSHPSSSTSGGGGCSPAGPDLRLRGRNKWFGGASWEMGSSLAIGRSPTSPFPRAASGRGSSRGSACRRLQEAVGGMDLVKVVSFGRSRGGLVAGRRPWRWETRRSWADCAARMRAGIYGRSGGIAAGGCRTGEATEELKHQSTSLAQYALWPTVMASVDVVFLPVGSVVVLLLLPYGSG